MMRNHLSSKFKFEFNSNSHANAKNKNKNKKHNEFMSKFMSQVKESDITQKESVKDFLANED